MGVFLKRQAVELMTSFVAHNGMKSAATSLIAVQPKGRKPPLFCVHGFRSYFYLARALGSDQPIYGLAQHAGQTRIRHIRIEDIATHYIEEIQTIQAQGPYLLAGHSVGGVIAFEMARQLQKAGQKVALLALLEPSTPQMLLRQKSSTPCFTDRVRRRWAELLRLKPKEGVKYVFERVTKRFSDKFREVICALYHLVGIPLPSSLETFYVEEVVYGKIYPKARKAYAPGFYDGPITIFKGTESSIDPQLWKQWITGEVEVFDVPGGHLTMINAPHVYILAGQLETSISKARVRFSVPRDLNGNCSRQEAS